LKVGDDEARRYGNSSVINIECSKCEVKIELQTSGNKSQAWKPQNAMDTNRRMVYSSMEMGVGREGMSVLCDVFNMPPPCHHKAWDNYVAALYEAHKQAVAEQLQKARDKVFARHSSDETDVVEIAVSYDGTWSKRGYTANFGVGFVISVETGEVLDFDFESKLCKECETTKRDLGEDSCEFDIWYGGHKDQCTQTHTGSSGSMECSIAKKIWDRSKDRNSQYKFMICDGDSKAYGSIWDTYGCCDDCEKWEKMDKRSAEYKKWRESKAYEVWKESHESGKAECARVSKLDCIGHVQKRMGTHLRELRKSKPKLDDGKSVKGSKHRLTDKTMDKLQTYYGNAIRANVKPGKLTPEEQKEQITIMQRAIMAVLYHTCELNNKERHKYCPPGPDSWCSYKRDGTLQRKDHHLDPVFLNFLLPECKRLSEYSLLLRCLPGYSQNANESLNGLVWNRAPKHRYKGAHVVETAVMSAILSFNAGAASRQDVMKVANIPGGAFTLEGCTAKDEKRMSHSVRKTKTKEKERRRKIRQAKLAANQGETSYASGMFNEVDPLDIDASSSDDDDDDDYPLARLLDSNESEDSDDAPLAEIISRNQQK
jgi:hypothetical protein